MSPPRRNTYTPQQLAMFATFTSSREACRPAECHYPTAEGERCWVREGPPGIDGLGHCVGCHGTPRERLAG